MKFRQKTALLLSISLLSFLMASCSGEQQADNSVVDTAVSNRQSQTENSSDSGTGIVTHTDGSTNILRDDDSLERAVQLSESTQQNSSSGRTRRVKNQATEKNYPEWSSVQPADAKDYTIMVYMVGSNLESEYKAASMDILEMLDSSLNADNVNLVVYCGGADTWWIDIPQNVNSYLVYSSENGGEFSVYTESEKSMGETETFSTFLSETVEKFPAEHYGVICWDHGGGPLIGYGVDEKYPDPDNIFTSDCLTLQEMDTALSQSPFKEKKLDFFGFDACLMGTLEVADMLKEYAEVMIASPESEPGIGWNYSFLNALNQTVESSNISHAIIDSYAESVRNSYSSTSHPDYTLMAFDLSETERLLKETDDFFEDLSSVYQSENNRLKLMEIISASFAYGNGEYDLFDLGDFASLCSYFKETADSSQKLLETIDEIILYGRTNLPYSYGISVYLPYQCYNVFSALGENFIESSNYAPKYKSFMKSYTEPWRSESSKKFDSIPLSKHDEEEYYDYYQLTDEQLADFSGAYYTVMSKSSSSDKSFDADCYYPIMENIPVFPDENGMLTIDLDPEVIMAVSGSDEDKSMIARFRYVSQQDNEVNYESVRNALATNIEYIGEMIEYHFVKFSIKAGKDVDKAVIKSITSEREEETDFVSGGKNDISTDELHALYCYYCPVEMPDGDKTELYYEMENTGHITIAYMDMQDEFSYKPRYLSETGEEDEFYYQLVIRDMSGTEHAASVTKIPDITEFRTVTEKTEKGEYTFRLYEDYAVLNDYEGEDEILEVPSEIQGLPVTKIGGKAFEANAFKSPLKELKLPDTITVLGNYAFTGCGNLEKITLPAKLSEISYGAFQNTMSLKKIEIPESVTKIGKYAFKGSGLEKFQISSKITEIGAGAFSSCDNLQELTVDSSNRFYTVQDILKSIAISDKK